MLRKTVADGVQEGHVGYISGPKPELGPDGRFQVAWAKVRYKPQVAVPEDEIDLESGFLMVPQAIPQSAPAPGPGPSPAAGPGPVPPGPGPGPIPPGPQPPVPPGPTPGPPAPATQNTVDLSFAADRDALFTAWNAIANLADMAGKVNVTIHAESPAGFDKGKLNNGVMEPLREADLIE